MNNIEHYLSLIANSLASIDYKMDTMMSRGAVGGELAAIRVALQNIAAKK